MKYVRDEDKLADEDEDLDAGYKMQETSTLMIVSTADNENDISAQLRMLPHSA